MKTEVTTTQINGIDAVSLLERFNALASSIQEVKQLISNNPDTELITRKQVAKLFDVSLVTLSEWCKKGIIPYYKIGSRVKFKKSEVLEALKIVEPRNTNY